jgi:hypothetical protein
MEHFLDLHFNFQLFLRKKSMVFAFLGCKRSRKAVFQWFLHQELTRLFTYGGLKDYISAKISSQILWLPWSLTLVIVALNVERRWDKAEETDGTWGKKSTRSRPIARKEIALKKKMLRYLCGALWTFTLILNVRRKEWPLPSPRQLWTYRKHIFRVLFMH